MTKQAERVTVAQLAEQVDQLQRRVEQLEAALAKVDRRRRHEFGGGDR